MPANQKWTIIEGDGPRRSTRSRAEYDALWRDLLLRLEVTPAHKSLNILCEDRADAKRINASLRRKALSLGNGVVGVSIEGATVIVQRGPNWAKRDAGVLAHVPAHSLDAPSANGSGRKPSGRPPGRPRKTKDQTPD